MSLANNNTTINQYKQFMTAHTANKENKLPITNTRIGSKSVEEPVYGGTYSIPDDKYSDFIKLYSKYVFECGNPEYLTEKQLETSGPIAIDIDFRYKYDICDRIHTIEHIDDIVLLYLEKLKGMFQFTDIPFYIFVMEKEGVNRKENIENPAESLTKDGIHMIISIQADRTQQLMLREQVVENIGKVWSDLPIINKNKWEDAFDIGISAGYTNWQLYGSCKPGCKPYRLTYIYKNLFDPADKEFIIKKIKLNEFNILNNIEKLSIRNTKNQSYIMSTEFLNLYEERQGIASTAAVKKRSIIVQPGTIYYAGNGAFDEILSVKNKAELDLVLGNTLDQLNIRDYELVETHKYTMTLPESYYGNGSYDKWIRVGWALANTCNLLFVSWIALSAKSPAFNYSDIRDLYDKWQRFDSKGNAGLTRRSIMHWSKQDAFVKFKEVRTQSVDYYVEKTLDRMMDDFSDTKRGGGKPCGDFDIANVLKQLYKDEYVCVSIKNNIWYRFHNHRWMEIDSGTTLRKAISTELHDIYKMKMDNLESSLSSIQGLDESDERIKRTKKKMGKICDICLRLVSTTDKKNIMTEAKELFHDSDFMESLDTNPYLLCFENGVIDFKEKVFRKGYPEDYISKSTCIEYIPINQYRDSVVIAEINDFMSKLFPREELREYMWDHLASILLGTPDKQTFHMYLGEGRNGKSVLTTLIDEIMGEYKGVVPLSAITQERAKVGGTAAELAELKGVRYAVIMEPSKKDAIMEGPLKQLTSGLDPIQCRAPYSAKTMIYYPQFKLVLCSNVRMEIKTQDFGTWRRIREVPFESLFTENPVKDDPDKPFQFLVDGTIVDKFSYWKFTFMAMLVARAFKTDGKVGECAIVTNASRAYQESQDFIAEFIRDKIKVDANGSIKKSALNTEFMVWFMNTYGRGAPSPKDVHTYMDKKFGKYDRKGAWTGVAIKYENDDNARAAGKQELDEFEDDIDENDL